MSTIFDLENERALEQIARLELLKDEHYRQIKRLNDEIEAVKRDQEIISFVQHEQKLQKLKEMIQLADRGHIEMNRAISVDDIQLAEV